MNRALHTYAIVAALVVTATGRAALADGIVYRVVNSPLAAAGLARNARVGINIQLQSDAAPGLEFMDPEVIGYGIPAGGHIDIELGAGFERDPAVALTQKTIMLVTGAPQQGMPGQAVGYTVGEGGNPRTIRITPTKPEGLPASVTSPAPGAKDDPIPSRGIKVFHVGLLESAFVNRGESGAVSVRIIDAAGAIQQQGDASAEFLASPVAQIQPTNFPDAQRNHNWQRVPAGTTLGQTPGTLPLPIMLFRQAQNVPPAELGGYKDGILGAGVLSTQQLAAMGFEKPPGLARYNGGLVVQDSNGDGQLDPVSDRIIGGVMGKAPSGAKGQELRSLDVHGAIDLSRPTTAYHAKFGGIFGGAIGLLQFSAGDQPGLYRPIVALLADPRDPSKGDGSSYTFTIVVQ